MKQDRVSKFMRAGGIWPIKAIYTSFQQRALYKDNRKYSNSKTKIFGIFFTKLQFMAKTSNLKGLRQIWWLTTQPL